MRHPFDGIHLPASPSRRTWLGWMAALAAALGLSRVVTAAAPPGSRLNVPAEPSPEPDPEPKPKPSTLALKEAGGKPSTAAAGEEGGPSTEARREEGGVSTRALGEEGAMTRALNEAGGPIRATTLAVGEEGGKKGEAPKEKE
jgi:hypothetical protein